MKSLNDYPMHYSTADSVNLYLYLRGQNQRRAEQITIKENESKNMTLDNKQRFEAIFEKKRRPSCSYPSYRTSLSLSSDPQLLNNERCCNIKSEKIQEKTVPGNQQPVTKPGPFLARGVVLNHCRATCRFQPRICRHIRATSPLYRLIATSRPDRLDLQEEQRNDATPVHEFMFVPLQEPCLEEVIEEIIEGPASATTVAESKHTTLDNICSVDQYNEKVSDVLSELQDEQKEEEELGCWVDYASVTSAKVSKSTSLGDRSRLQSGAELVECSDKGESDDGLRVSHKVKSASVHALSKEDVGGQKKGQEQVKHKAVLPKPAEARFDSVDIAFPEQDEEAEEESEPEPEPEPEPVPPGTICPSSANKSLHAEVRIWLESSSFVAANKVAMLTN